MMNPKTSKILEFEKIITMLQEQTGSPMTRKLLGEFAPMGEVRDIRRALDETSEAVALITLKGPMPLGNFYDIGGLLNLAKKGGSLSMGELLQVGYNLNITAQVATFLEKDTPEIPFLAERGSLLAVHSHLQEEIDRCILTEDEMSDNASPELRQIRRQIQRQGEALKAKVNQIINSQANRSFLQDAIVTIRDGRYVIPVKAEHRSMVPGIIHDQSGSGQTLFIEPQSVVNMNNELRQLEVDEQAEVARILKDLSERVAELSETLMNNQRLLVELDTIHAKGKLALAMNAEKPVISEEGVLRLKQARHPLIDPKQVVPIDVTIGEDYTALIITGPNTGGKTVTLKTCGLLSMMALAGLHIPAFEGSSVPLYRDIFADIGDEQSIEQSLSTFSSHMKNIVAILKEADDNTLVLMDELGAGTDPTEGAALAIAILESLIDRGSQVLATTHYTELKKFAVTKDGVGNASMQFDVETLSPTYKLIMGMPGRSNAFEISQKLGLDPAVIDNASSLVDTGQMAFEEVLTAIEGDRKAAEAERDEAVALTIQMQQLRDELSREKEKTQKAKDKILSDARAEAKQMIREAEEFSKDIREELRELAQLESLGERNKRFDDSRRKIKDAAGRYREQYIQEINENPVSIEDLKVGDMVRVVSLGQNGEVLALPDKRGDVQVQVGPMKVKAKAEDLTLIIDGKRRKKHPAMEGKRRYGGLHRAKAQSVSPTFTVRGQNLDDARENVLKYIDDAVMAGLPSATIIHGRGEGILMKGLREEFDRHPHVKSWRKGSFDEGGDGVTVITLK